MTKRDPSGTKGAGKSAMRRRDFLKTAGAAAGALATNIPLVNIARADSNVIKIGHFSLMTGARSSWGLATPWVIGRINELLKGGLQIGGKNYTVEILDRDTQSDPNRTASLANELVLSEKVDMILNNDGIAAPAMEICDNNRTPMVTTFLQWEPFYAQRGSSPDKGYDWNFLFFWSAAKIIENFIGLWNSVPTNKKVGTAFIENEAGQGMEQAFSAAIKNAGYAEVPGGRYRIETDDFSTQVAKFKGGDAQILTGLMFNAHVATMLGQMGQAAYSPEVMTFAAACVLPTDVEALGDRGNGMSCEASWTPSWGTTSSLTNQSVKDFVADWEDSTGKQWIQWLGHDYAKWEIAIAALKASGDPKDRDAVRNAINTLMLDTIVGKIDFKNSKLKSVAETQLAAGQWRKAKSGKFPYDFRICYNGTAPDVTVDDEFKLLSQIS
jgi:branched-chain amino acid transport system substrate-binding protein